MALKCFVAKTERKEIYSGFISRYIPISLVHSTIYWLITIMGSIYQFICYHINLDIFSDWLNMMVKKLSFISTEREVNSNGKSCVSRRNST